MTQYEYLLERVHLPADGKQLAARLNELGSQGWRLVMSTTVNASLLWFIRELGDGPPIEPPIEPPEEVTEPPVVIDAPYASGPSGEASATVGETVNCTMGNWEGEPSRYAYLWKRRLAGGQVIPLNNETGPEYDTATQDGGNSVFCAIEASNDYGQAYSESNDVAVSASEVVEPQRKKK
jgi:hypothetical protein